MATLEEILKSEGYTDADIQAASGLLGDARFRGAVEKTLTNMGTQLTAFQDENNRWADHFEKTVKPQLDGLQREKVELSARAGSLEARVKALDPNYKAEEPPPAAQDRSKQPPDPNGNYLTAADFEKKVTEYAAHQGTAIALANDLAMEYKRLTGNDMLDYSYSTRDGRTLHGMSGLLQESRDNNRPLPDYISAKFDFAGKRAQAAAKQREDAIAAIRKDERAKVMGELGNPNTRPLMPSQQPFIPPRQGEGNNGMPWNDKGIVNKAQLRSKRIQNAMETQARSLTN
jgi:hypothetical protein